MSLMSSLTAAAVFLASAASPAQEAPAAPTQTTDQFRRLDDRRPGVVYYEETQCRGGQPVAVMNDDLPNHSWKPADDVVANEDGLTSRLRDLTAQKPFPNQPYQIDQERIALREVGRAAAEGRLQ